MQRCAVNLDPLRRLGFRVRAVLLRQPRWLLAGLLVTLLALPLAIAVSAPGAAPAATTADPAAPTFTYARTWSLLDLQRHVEAGEVVAITVPPAEATADGSSRGSSNFLVARTVDSQLVRVSLSVSVGEAVAALNGFGYGQLLTSEALSSLRTAAVPAAGSDTLRTLVSWLIPLLLIALLVVVFVRMMARNSGNSGEAGFRFATPDARRRDSATGAGSAIPAVRLEDVAGVDEAKLELTETIEFLRTPERFRQLGARIPRGIMLYGPPGTGKTMLARAVAAEAGVPFHYASGSDFVEKYVGVGAKRIRDFFSRARKLGRGVIFFDEFDALGKARGGASSHEEREQTLNQLLVELDGFSTTEDVVVIAATNRVDIVDPAVLRPGRFTRKIHVGLPDVVGRREILAVHARNKPIAEPDALEGLARKTYGFSGAQLADLLNEAAILAARRGATDITPEDLHGGWLKVAVGTSRRRSMDERERSIIAAHEVGHAIAGRVHGDKRRVEEISIYTHGEALGVTVSSQEDNDLPSESDLRARLIALMGGRAAEELLFHEVTGGASNDFDKANQIATTMVTKWGMGHDPEAKEGGTSGRGPPGFLVVRPNGSLPTEVQASATRAIRAILDEAYAEACATLVANMETLRRIAAYLVEHERLDGDTFDALVDATGTSAGPEPEWRPATSRPRAWHEIPDFMERRSRPAVPLAAAVPDALHRDPGREVLPAPVPAPVLQNDPASGAAQGRTAQRRGARSLLGALTNRRLRPLPLPALAVNVGRRVRSATADHRREAVDWLAGDPDAVVRRLSSRASAATEYDH